MIKSIKLKNVATYSPEGVQIEELKPISFIFGGNGTGKTTISKFINDQKNDIYLNCSLEWDNDQPLKTYVYNKNFREQSFFKGNIPGVFTLGKYSVDRQKALIEMKNEKEELRKTFIEEKNRLKGIEDKIDKEVNRFKETVWDLLYKPNKVDFKDAFKGANYKETFKKRLLKEYQDNTAELLAKEDLLFQAKTIFGERPHAIDLLPLLNVERLKEIEELEVWETPIVGKKDVPIADMIKKLGSSDWFFAGQKLIVDNICPFCQQATISEDFKKQLECFFDESYKGKLKEVVRLGDEYFKLSNNLIFRINQLEKREELNADTKIDWSKFKTEIKLLESRLNETKKVMSEKIKEPGRKFSITLLTDLYDQLNDRIIEANKAIKSHNEVVNNFNISHRHLVEGVWRYIIENAKLTIESHNKDINGLMKSREILKNTHAQTINRGFQLKKEIEELTIGTTGIEFSELEMNKILESYGFNNFRIVSFPENNNFYQIQRADGSPVESTLSDGEITFITFLYFYQLAKGGHTESTVNERRVLVVDDPISNLDSKVLFVVSSLLRKCMHEIRSGEGNITQLILLTHNSYFHKQMAMVAGRDQLLSDTAFWLLRKGKKWTILESYGAKNPISTYELLWNELKTVETESNIMLLQTMRRILESYFTVYGQFSEIKKLPDSFETIEEKMICKSLISWIHDGSNDIADEIHLSDYYEASQSYKDVFRKLFEINHQLGHYNQMMGIKEECYL